MDNELPNHFQIQGNQKYTETIDSQGPLRRSLFGGVPPFINYVPAGGFTGGTEKGPQYWDVNAKWDQDQLWRFCMAINYWVHDCVASEELAQSENHSNIDVVPAIGWTSAGNQQNATLRRKRRVNRQSMIIKPPFEQRANDAKSFRDMHPGVLLTQFPKLHQISRKDLLGKNYAVMNKSFPQEYNFHPITFNLPEDRKKLTKKMIEEESGDFWYDDDTLWIVKPPNQNNGTGIKVISNSIDNIPNYPTCVQKYVKNPLLIDGYKFDIRLYVLVTSLEPLRLYLYDDGLVRIATEEYSEDPEKLYDSCVHVCNYAINCKNKEKFIYNNNPSECEGNKWRLRCFWKYLRENCYIEYEQMESLWEEMKDVVIKTLLISHKETCMEFLEASPKSMYNCYKLLGFDVLVDNNLKVHLMEVNARPELKDDVIDKVVNRPMLAEMVRIIGFHMPESCDKYRHFLQKKFNLNDKTKNGNYQPYSFQWRLYTRILIQEDHEKQEMFSEQDNERENYLTKILEEFSPADVRYLIKMEEERFVSKGFNRIFPTSETHKYFKFFGDRLPYFDKLYDAYEHAYSGNRGKGIRRLRRYCENGYVS